jgi:hypothetical protein
MPTEAEFEALKKKVASQSAELIRGSRDLGNALKEIDRLERIEDLHAELKIAYARLESDYKDLKSEHARYLRSDREQNIQKADHLISSFKTLLS